MKTKDYQHSLARHLADIFGQEMVETEWDSVKYDGHTSNHRTIYAPRHDIVVGPFNSYADLDVGRDNTELMKVHPFTKRIVREIGWDKGDFKNCWNDFARCYLAIEIELGGGTKKSNSLKHIFGSVVNASVSGAIGIVVVNEHTSKKVERVYGYIGRLKYLERLIVRTIDNLVIIDEDELLDIVREVKGVMSR